MAVTRASPFERRNLPRPLRCSLVSCKHIWGIRPEVLHRSHSGNSHNMALFDWASPVLKTVSLWQAYGTSALCLSLSFFYLHFFLILGGLFIILYVCFCMCMHIHHIHAWCLWRQEEGIRFSELDSCGPPWEYRESKPGPLREQQVLLITDPSLQPSERTGADSLDRK